MQSSQASVLSSRLNKPLIKWTGGKRWLLSQLLPKIGTFGTYYEPFAGGASLFFALQPQKACLIDSNVELINFYQQISDNVVNVCAELDKFENSEIDYYRIRQWRPTTPAERAARLYYLTKLSFNGIYRVNLHNEFNVPYGKRELANIHDYSDLMRSAPILQKASLIPSDFRLVEEMAVAGDFVYFDPPYTVSHNNNGFIKYNQKLFSWSDQIDLSTIVKRLTNRGVSILLSNADHNSVCELYNDLKITKISRSSVMAADPMRRKIVTEILVEN